MAGHAERQKHDPIDGEDVALAHLGGQGGEHGDGEHGGEGDQKQTSLRGAAAAGGSGGTGRRSGHSEVTAPSDGPGTIPPPQSAALVKLPLNGLSQWIAAILIVALQCRRRQSHGGGKFAMLSVRSAIGRSSPVGCRSDLTNRLAV